MSRAPIRTFGRTRSRSLRIGQAARLEQIMPRLSIAAGPYDPAAEAGGRPVWLEIGFGSGEHLAGQAARQPDVLFLGAEPFLNGQASAVRHLEALALGNVRLWPGDGRALMAALPNASIERLFLLFPDPWPKSRHRKRRLVDGAFVAEAARILSPGGHVRFASDWADYVNQALEVFRRSPDFIWTAMRSDDWRVPPADHVTTRYQQKRLGDCRPVWLEFARR